MLERLQARAGGRYIARELGALAFNRRVFAQAADHRVPILERLRFLCIVSSNMDELFEIRVAELKERIKLGNDVSAPGELTPSEALRAISEQAHTLVEDQYRLLNKDILPALEGDAVRFSQENDWTTEHRAWLHAYFMREVMPVLTPIGLDPAHPFPRVLNKSLNFVVQLEGVDAFGRNSNIAIVQAPRLLPRVIRLPRSLAGEGHRFVLLTAVLQAFVGELFPGMTVI